MNIDEVLNDVGWPTQNERVCDEIRGAYGDRAWVQKNFFGLREDEQLMYGWKDFVKAVKHKTRYLFAVRRPLKKPITDESIPPHKMLDEIGEIVERVGLVTTMRGGTQWHRARIHDAAKKYMAASELGTVPQSKALYSNRMSPAGIPMFYGAADMATAIAETYTSQPGKKAVATVGVFETARDTEVLDLTTLPSMPSFFDESNRISGRRSIFCGILSPISQNRSRRMDESTSNMYPHRSSRSISGTYSRLHHGNE